MWNCSSKLNSDDKWNWSSEEIWFQTDDEFNYGCWLVVDCAGGILWIPSATIELLMLATWLM